MINPAQISLTQPDGTKRQIIIEPILEKTVSNELRSTGVFKIYKDAFGDESALFTEPKENTGAGNLPDEQNPDYLGKITLNGTTPVYNGELLSHDEQRQAADYITAHQ